MSTLLIHSIAFYDKGTNWQLEETTLDDLTLLVGASGVGKTKILQKIELLKRIVLGDEGEADRGEWSWALVFSLDEGSKSERYRWWGRTEWRKDDVSAMLLTDQSTDQFMVFAEEYLEKESQGRSYQVFSRQKDHFTFGTTSMPKLHSGKSALALLAEEAEIAPVRQAFQGIVILEEASENFERIRLPLSLHGLTVEQIRASQVAISHKLAALHEVNLPRFQQLVTEFTAFFPTVEGLRFVSQQRESTVQYELQLKESGCAWINWQDVSTGMRKTWFHLVAFELLPDNSVVLIDEFENGLGVNCLDQSFHRLDGRDDIQFILTSHHPYIINQIPMKSWKIVSREKGKVITHDASYYQLGHSKHEAFKQLLNLAVFTEGREVD